MVSSEQKLGWFGGRGSDFRKRSMTDIKCISSQILQELAVYFSILFLLIQIYHPLNQLTVGGRPRHMRECDSRCAVAHARSLQRMPKLEPRKLNLQG
jgi:hypothetical protein